MKALVYHGPGRARLGHRRRPVDHRSDRHPGPDRQLDDLRHRPAHPQGRRARDDARHRARPRGRRHRRRRSDASVTHRGGRRPRAAVVRQRVRALPLLQGSPLRPVPRRRRLDLRTHDRRAAGRVRARAVRRQLRLQGPDGAQRRAGPVPRRHPADRLRGRRAQRHGRRPATSSRSSAPGPIGLAAILTAQLYTPGRIVAIDLADSRLESAMRFGADTTINNGREDALAQVMELTDGLGADVAFEAVGVPETFELATELIRPGGRVANIGVHGKPATLHLEKLWIRDVTITTGLVDTYTIPRLMKLVAERPPGPDDLRHPPLRARRHDGRLRHVRRRGLHRRAEGRARGQRARRQLERTHRRDRRRGSGGDSAIRQRPAGNDRSRRSAPAGSPPLTTRSRSGTGRRWNRLALEPRRGVFPRPPPLAPALTVCDGIVDADVPRRAVLATTSTVFKHAGIAAGIG